MNDNQKDKILKSKFNTEEKVPDNINNIFDKFIEENITNKTKSENNVKTKSNIIQFRKTKKVLSAVASTASVLFIGGTIYAAVTGKSLISLFNINEEKYQEHLISVNEQVTSEDINVELIEYAVDHNAVIVNYKVTSEKELNFIENRDNLIAKSTVNDGSIELNIDNQNFMEYEGSYIVSTLYAIEQFEETLDKFSLKIEISKIAGSTGKWEFNLNIDKSQTIENRTYTYYNKQTFLDTNRIPIKTNYLPISMNVGTVSISDFSTAISITIFNNQVGIPEEHKLDPKKDIWGNSPETQTKEWKQIENFLFELENDKGEVLGTVDYDYTRKERIKQDRIFFKNISSEVKSLTLKVYLKGNNNQNELVGKFELALSNENLRKDEFTITKTMNKGKITYKIPETWRFYNFEDYYNSIDIKTFDDFGNLVTISLTHIKKTDYEEFGIDSSSSLEYIATKNSAIVREMTKKDQEIRIISHGEEKIGNISGYEITYSFKSNNSENWDSKIKELYFKSNDELYEVRIDTDGEIAIANYLEMFNKFVESIEINN